MNDLPLISIIVPVYNKEKYLTECVRSLIDQTYPNKEIILVDDGSTDDSARICDEFAARNETVQALHKENGGPSSAWKAGFKISGGKYIVFADSDDYLDTSMLEDMQREIRGVQGEMVLSDYAITMDDGNEKHVYQALKPGTYDRTDIERSIIPNLLGNEQRLISFSRCMKLISRSLIEDNFDYCDDRVLMGDDSTIILPCIIDSQMIHMMDHKVYYHYRYIDDSIVHRYDESAFDNNRLFYDALKSMIENKLKNDEDTRKTLLEGLNKEEIMMMLLLVKNEVRGNPEGCLHNLRKYRKREFVKDIVENTRADISDRSNKLLYMVLKRPSRLRVGLLRTAFAIYYRNR